MPTRTSSTQGRRLVRGVRLIANMAVHENNCWLQVVITVVVLSSVHCCRAGVFLYRWRQQYMDRKYVVFRTFSEFDQQPHGLGRTWSVEFHRERRVTPSCALHKYSWNTTYCFTTLTPCSFCEMRFVTVIHIQTYCEFVWNILWNKDILI